MKIYLSGPMSGHADFNYPAFNEMAAELRKEGHDVVNPAELDADTGKEWADYMRNDIRHLVECDAIATLCGWEKSRGATLEVFIATQLGMNVYKVGELL